MDDLHDLTPFYVVDALDDLEHRRYEDHLDGCARCREELVTLGPGFEALLDGIAEAPPAGLRASVMAAVDDEVDAAAASGRRRANRIAAALTVAAAVVVLVVAIGLRATDPVDEVYAAEDAVVLEVDGSPFGPTTIAYSEELGRAVFMAEDMPDPGAGRTYQLWLIGEGGPRPAGVFTPEQGRVTVILDGTVVEGLTVGLTIEPEGGSPSPTGEILIAEPLT